MPLDRESPPKRTQLYFVGIGSDPFTLVEELDGHPDRPDEATEETNVEPPLAQA